jgi:autotransporter passenger strand-loop-strand repeat protein
VDGAKVSGGIVTATDAVVSGGVIKSNGTVTLSGTSLAEAVAVEHAGVLNASSGTQLTSDVVFAHGTQNVDNGATASGTILSGGYEYINGGLAISTTILRGGRQDVDPSGSATGTTVMAGGSLIDESLTNNAVLLSGGSEKVTGTGRADATLIDSGADLKLDSGATTSATTIIAGGTMDLTSFIYAPGGSATLNAVDQLIVVEDYQTEIIQLAGNYAGETFTVGQDSRSGTLITVSAAQNTDPAALLHELGGVTSAHPFLALHPTPLATGAAASPDPTTAADALGHDLLPHIQ